MNVQGNNTGEQHTDHDDEEDEDDGAKVPTPKKARGQEVTIKTTWEDTSYQEEVKELEEECKKEKPRRKKLS